MARYRSRSRSPVRRKRYDDPRDRRSDRRSPGPSGLLIRNISLSARPEDLRIPFERFGPIKDVYLPKNYYTGEPRGFGFVKFRYPEDAAEAKSHLNHTVIGGREIRIVFAEENRKTPHEMRRTGGASSRSSRRRRSPSSSPRRQYHSHSRSHSPAQRYSRFIIDKERPKVLRIIKRNEKRNHKVNDFLLTYLSMPLEKFLILLSSWITFKSQGILFFMSFSFKALALQRTTNTDLLKKESKAYSWPKKSSSKKQSFSKLLLIEVW